MDELLRIEGPDPPSGFPFSPLGRTPSWTGGDVLIWIKRAFGTNPATRNLGEARPLSWPDLYLSMADPQRFRKRDILLTWARCRMERESFAEACRGRGWPPATAYRLRDEAAEEIAQGINAEIVRGHGAVTGP